MKIIAFFSGREQKRDLLITLIIWCNYLTGAYPLSGQTPSSLLKEEIRKIIARETEISLEQHKGFAMSVIDGDSIWYFSFGSNMEKLEGSISPQDIFEIGGVTKVFTADLCYRLAEKGNFDLGITVEECLPSLGRNPFTGKISLSRLLNHTSGLPGLPSNLAGDPPGNNGRYSEYDSDELLLFLGNYTPVNQSYKYQYAHLNYALIELLLESITGIDWETLMKKYIWDEDSMYCTGTSSNPQLIPIAGFDRTGNLVNHWAFASFLGSEGMLSCLRDLTHYTNLLSNKDAYRNRIYNMVQPANQIKVQGNIYAAHGWHVIRRGKKPNILLHSGKTGGHAASIHIVPDTRTAVIIVTRSTSSMDGLAMHVLRMINFNWKRKSEHEK